MSLLSFLRYDDLLVENMRFSPSLPTPVWFEALAWGFPSDRGMERRYQIDQRLCAT